MQDTYVLEASSVCFSYPDGQMALDGATLGVKPRDCAVIVGANGCGKSTLLKILDGLYSPTSGAVHAFGKPLTRETLAEVGASQAFRRRVGLVFQDPDVQLFMPSVFDELSFAPLQLGIDPEKVRDRIDAAASELRIEHLLDRAPHHLSGGEKRRVALASVLTLQPEVWLLDEPSAGLDPRSHSWLIEFIRQQRELGKTIVTATHDLGLAEEIASVVHVFSEERRIVASGPPNRILSDHDLLHRCNLYHYHSRTGGHTHRT